MLVSFSGFEHSEVLLDHCYSEDWALWSFEHAGWDFDKLADFVFVSDAVKHLFFCGFVQVLSRKLN